MKLEFNTLGVLINSENTSIRQGSKGNEIIAEFDGFSNLTHVAKINISRPDGSHIDNIVMNPIPSIQNSFKLTLNDVWYSAISGTASLTIYLYDGNGNIVANGQVNFDIEESDYYEEQGTITPKQYDYLLEQVAQAQASQKEYTDNGNVVDIDSEKEEISDEEYEVLNHINSKVRVDSKTLFYKGSGEEDTYLRYYNLLPQSVKKENGETVLQLETIIINANKEISFTNTEIVIDTDNCIELTSNAGVLSTAKINALKKNNAYIKYNNYYYRKRNVVVNGDQQTLYFTRERFENPTANSFQVVTEMFNISTSNRSYALEIEYHPSVYTTAYINNVVSALNDSISASGHSLDLQVDESTYEYTIRLKDANNNILSSVKINLPLESIVLGAQYYGEYTYGGTTYEKVIVITLATSDVPVIIPVGDLVSGLVSTEQLNTALATKVGKMGFQHPNNDYAYIQEANGNEGALPISIEPSMGAIPRRDISGGIIVQETPTNNQHATSKAYVDKKQDKLVSGTNIKTINNISLLGSGNIDIQGGSGNAEWGSIGGDIADQTDLQNELQDIREVAEGKCKTYVINASTETTVNSDFYDRYSRFVDGEITPFDSKQEMDDWLSEERRAVINPVFKSQDDVIILRIGGTNQNANLPDYFVVSSQNIADYITTREFILITLSDIIHEQVAFKLGDNLYITNTQYPDRWVSLVYRTPNLGSGVRFHALETSKVNLYNYSTKSETSTEVNKVAHDIATEYDENTLYGSGDLCIKDKLLYKCNTNNTTGTWDNTKWDLTTVNSELGVIKGDYVDLTSAQTIGGNKRFTQPIDALGGFNPNTNGYKLTLPDTTSWTADKEIATIDKLFPFETILPPSSTTLTSELINKFINGVAVNGTFLSKKNSIFFPLQYIQGQNSIGFYLSTGSSGGELRIGRYIIKPTNVIYLDGDSEISFSGNTVTISGKNVAINGSATTKIKNKTLPNYPTDTTKQYKLVQQVGGTLAWVEDN